MAASSVRVRGRELPEGATRAAAEVDAAPVAVKKKRKLSKKQAKAFLATEQGQEWLARKIEEKNASRRDPGPAPERLTRTKFPFKATIKPLGCVAFEVIVWPDWIEHEERDGPPWKESHGSAGTSEPVRRSP